MKNKNLYIIGNGFDLYLKLKTSYDDFFETKLESNNNEYSVMRKNIWQDIEKKAKGLFDGAELSKVINRTKLPELQNNSIFLLYLLLEKDNEIEYWNDVEKKIFPCAKELEKLSELNDESFLKEFQYFTNEYIEDFKQNEEIIRKIILRKCIQQKKYREDYNYLVELNKFEKEFGDYIKEINEKVFTEDVNGFRDNKFIDKIHKVFQEDKNETNIVINFNYTTYLKEMDYISEMTNVHGTFENPIFGIDNTEIGNDREFYYLTKTSRVLFNNTIKEEFKLPNKIEISKICFFGHSLARADYSYFQSIFDYYDIYNSEVKLEFKYYNYIKDKKELTDEEKEERKDEVKSNMHKSVIELMNDYGNTASNKSRGQNLLHKLILENRIKIVEVE
jgi:hypothetical protein